MKTILTLIDFSDVTLRLIEQSRRLAAAFQSRVILLHAVPPEAVVLDLGIVSPTVMHAPSGKRIASDFAKLTELRDSLASSGIEVTAQQLDDTSIEKVVEVIRDVVPDLVIVGSHHHGCLFTLLAGTYTSDVLKRADCPVLVVPAGRP